MGHVGKTVTQNVVSGSEITDGTVTGADLASDIAISTSGAITTTGAFTSPGIDDNGDATTITLDANEDITAANGMYVSGDLTSLTIDKGGIDRSGNTTRIISARSGGNYADMSINIAGADLSDGNSGMNRCLYIDYQGNTTIDQGNLVIGTSGKGISFAATGDGSGANQSELLDDYEEGTWTPVITSGGNTLSVSGGTQFYKYVKVGKMCSLFYNAGNVTVSGTAASGDQRITGLPFAGATNGRQSGTTPMYYTSGGLRYNSKDFLALSIGSGATEIEIVGYDNSSGYANPGTPSTGSGTYFWWQLTYEVA
jgi:hypothetical protein